MTYTIGTNCDVILQHAAVNAGAPFGFLLAEGRSEYGPAPSLQREAYDNGDGTFTQKQKHFFAVRISDNARNPDRTIHADDAATMYAMLELFLQQTTGITLTTRAGVFTALGAQGHFATETPYTSVCIVSVQLSNENATFAPADPVVYAGSYWDGAYCWDEGYWVEG